MLAGAELFPEFLTDRCEAEAIAEHILRWLNEPEAYQTLRAQLAELRAKVAEPGACERAARFVLAKMDERNRRLKLPGPLRVSA